MAASESQVAKNANRAADFAAKDAALRLRETTELPDTCFWHNELLVLNEKMKVPAMARYRKAVELFSRLRSSNIPPDSLTYASCMRAAGKARLPAEAELLFAKMKTDRVIASRFHFHALMSAWEQVGNLREVQRVFKQMTSEGLEPDIYTFNILVSACRDWRDAEEIVLWQMPEASVEADEYTFNSWLKVCVRTGEVAAAERAWSAFKASNQTPNSVTQKIVQKFTSAEFENDPVAQEIVREVSEIVGTSMQPPVFIVASEAVTKRRGELDAGRKVAGAEVDADVNARRRSGSAASSSKTERGEDTEALRHSRRVSGDACERPTSTPPLFAALGKQAPGTSRFNREMFREALEQHAEADRQRMGKPTGFIWIQVPRFGEPRNTTRHPSQTGVASPGKTDLPDPPEAKPRAWIPPASLRKRRDDQGIAAEIERVKGLSPDRIGLDSGFWRRFKEEPEPKPPPEWLLDLHGYSPAETCEVVSNKLESLAEPAGVKQEGALTLVTSSRRFTPRQTRIQKEIKGLLAYYGIKYEEGPGKLTVPSGALSEYAATRERKQLKQRIVKSAAGRYIGFGALVFAGISLTPLLLDRYAKKEEPRTR